jgi:hypothetical protein
MNDEYETWHNADDNTWAIDIANGPYLSNFDNEKAAIEAYRDWLAAKQEAAYEKFLERFYGGEVMTLDEQCAEARKLKL